MLTCGLMSSTHRIFHHFTERTETSLKTVWDAAAFVLLKGFIAAKNLMKDPKVLPSSPLTVYKYTFGFSRCNAPECTGVFDIVLVFWFHKLTSMITFFMWYLFFSLLNRNYKPRHNLSREVCDPLLLLGRDTRDPLQKAWVQIIVLYKSSTIIYSTGIQICWFPIKIKCQWSFLLTNLNYRVFFFFFTIKVRK